jgi:hypothetical protein
VEETEEQRVEREAREAEEGLGEALSEEQLLAAPLQEDAAPKIVVPKKGGPISESGTVKLAVMRPCVSRGKRIGGHPPIYTPQMLARNAKVLESWPMFMGHLPPDLVEKLRQYGRSPLDLGGRIRETYFDPEFRAPYDDDYGYRPGALMAEAIPYEAAEKIIERDPEGLHVSINAYPTAAKLGTVPWNTKQKGMMIEGLRRVPMGSVDWVIRGGAGGRVLTESEEAVVTILESVYGSDAMTPSKLEEVKNADELRAYVQEHASHLAPVLDQLQESKVTVTVPETDTTSVGKAVTPDELKSALSEFEQNISKRSEDQETAIQEAVQERIREREALRDRRDAALKIIREADPKLPATWREELEARYILTESGASPALLVEAEQENGVQTKSADEVLEEQVKADIERVWEMIHEARGDKRPVVRKQGGGGADQGQTESAAPDALTEFLVESGTAEKPDEAIDKLVEAAL